jgi:hypothetical protein
MALSATVRLNSVVVLPVDTNRWFKNKIISVKTAQTPENDEQPYFLDGSRLTMASDEQRQAFLRLRQREMKRNSLTRQSPTSSAMEV